MTNYFQIFSIVWGIIMVGLRLMMHVIPEKWARFELDKAYSEKKPGWVWIIAVVSVMLVALTWYMELTTAVNYSIVLTVLVTVTLIKVSQLLFNYSKFRRFAAKALVEDRRIITRINVVTTLLGVGLILLGIFVY